MDDECYFVASLSNNQVRQYQLRTENVLRKEENSSNTLKFILNIMPIEACITSISLIFNLKWTDNNTNYHYFTYFVVNAEPDNNYLQNRSIIITSLDIDNNWYRSKEDYCKWLTTYYNSYFSPFIYSYNVTPQTTIQPTINSSVLSENSSTTTVNTASCNNDVSSSKQTSLDVNIKTTQKKIAPHTKTINIEKTLCPEGREYKVCLTGSANLKKIYSLSVQLGSSFLKLDIQKVGIEHVEKSNTSNKEFKEIDRKKMARYDFEEEKYLRFLLKTVGYKQPKLKTKNVVVFVHIPQEHLTLKISMPVFRYEHGGYNYTKEELVELNLFSLPPVVNNNVVEAIVVLSSEEEDNNDLTLKETIRKEVTKKRKNTATELILTNLKLLGLGNENITNELLIDESVINYTIDLYGLINPNNIDGLMVKNRNVEAKTLILYKIRHNDHLTIIFSCCRLFEIKDEEDQPCQLFLKLKDGTTIKSKDVYVLKRATAEWLFPKFNNLSLEERNNFLQTAVAHRVGSSHTKQQTGEMEDEGFSDTEEPLSFEDQNEYLLDKLKNLNFDKESQRKAMTRFVDNKLLNNNDDNQRKNSIMKHLIPSKFLESNIGKISNSHKKENSIHFVVKAFIEEKLDLKEDTKNLHNSKYKCSFLFGKWKVEWKENNFVECKPLTNSKELIYYTDVFKIDEETYKKNNENKEEISKMFNDFVYQFARFCCIWNGVMRYDEKSCNSSHFVYCLIKYLSKESNYLCNLSTNDLLFPYLQSIGENNKLPLLYKPTVDFAIKFIDINLYKFKPEWEQFANWLLNNSLNTNTNLERCPAEMLFSEPKDINDFCSFVNYIYPKYFNKADKNIELGLLELRLLRNILISNTYKLSNIDEIDEIFKFNMYLDVTKNAIKRVKYIIEKKEETVVEGKVVPSDFAEFERSFIDTVDKLQV
ncbi:hypothetical protein ABK040_012104 [Willaertia magna]